MMKEVPIERLRENKKLFPGYKLDMVIGSILEGNTHGRLWEAGKEARLLLLWDQGNNVFYLSGEASTQEAQSELRQVISKEIRPSALETGAVYFSARTLVPNLRSALEQAFDGFLHGQQEKLFYQYRRSFMAENWPVTVKGIILHPIDKAFLSDPKLGNREAILGEIRWMWPSEEHFYQNGWGTAAVLADSAICWCTAEYVSGNFCGIGIETVEEHQGKGIATLAAARMVAEGIRRERVPHWECDAGNRPSVKVAEKLGFQLVEQEPFYFGHFK